MVAEIGHEWVEEAAPQEDARRRRKRFETWPEKRGKSGPEVDDGDMMMMTTKMMMVHVEWLLSFFFMAVSI